LRPLIDELKDLWNTGVDYRDVKEKENFTLRAMLLWTINDFGLDLIMELTRH
jgi:hypothetical protein